MRQILKLELVPILIALILQSCVSESSKRLQNIDDVLSESPDSAWVMLENETNFLGTYSKSERMKYHLLRAETMNKLFYSMDTITYIDEVLDYYSVHGNREEKILSCYMAGCVCRDNGDSPKALLYYNEAVNMMDTTEKDCNYSLLSKIYVQMAEIYRKQRYVQMEKKMLDIGSSFALKAKDTLGYFQAQDYKTSVYYKMGKMDSVYIQAVQTYRNYKSIGLENFAALSLMPLTEIYLKNKEYSKAKRILDEYFVKSKLLSVDGEPKFEGLEKYYYYLGRYYQGINRVDSALWCFRKLLNYPERITNLEAGYKGLMNVYCGLSKMDSVVKYAQLYADANDTANIRNPAWEFSIVQVLFDYSKSKEESIEKNKESKKLWATLFFALLVIVLLSFIVKLLKKKNLRVVHLYNAVCQKNVKMKRDVVSLQDELHSQKEKMVSLEKKIVVYQMDANDAIWVQDRELKNSKIFKSFMVYASKTGQPTISEWKSLVKLVEVCLPDFWQKISTFREMISSSNFKLCILTRLGFSPSQIANILGVSNQNISNERKKLVKFMFNSNETRKFDRFLMELGN